LIQNSATNPLVLDQFFLGKISPSGDIPMVHSTTLVKSNGSFLQFCHNPNHLIKG
jgi:hypothetical protein